MINRVVLVGRITKDIELRKTTSNLSVVNFSVAVDNNTKNADGSKTTSYINCIAWRQSAEFLNNYAKKGSLVGVEGRLQQRSFDRNDGSKASVLEVVADSVSLLESKSVTESRVSAPTSAIDIPDNSEESYDVPSGDLTEDDLPF